jgi:hypothetical protein|nr:MAG TPA: hypothetical protein [Caudoviricetes sp.]
MKGCTVSSDGTVKYLNPTDWTKVKNINSLIGLVA